MTAIRLEFKKEQGLRKIPSFAGAIGRQEEWKGALHPSVQNALIERRGRKS